ncbi:MAG: DNA polymerase, partial [Erysipelotrichaceae bacterium]
IKSITKEKYLNFVEKKYNNNLHYKHVENKLKYYNPENEELDGQRIKEINEKGFMKKEFGKRAAMNAPIQGTAADLIKVAMVKVNEEIHKRNLKSKMILQIHDELIFDVDKSEIELMKEIVKDSMENAMVLKVPLVASQSIADTWYDCK